MIDPGDEALVHKVLRRIIPFCILCYLLNFIDRTNIAIAQHSMHASIESFKSLTDAQFAAIYSNGVTWLFLPYCLFELPSNLIMRRVGARRWIARIMITWGIIATCFIFVRGTTSLYSLRALLGFAEAGFFPGIYLYLSFWIPHAFRARASALFFLSQALAQVIGNLMGGYILFLADKYHLPGQAWQWVFIAEGLPTIIVGIIALFYLTDYPADARWLAADERDRLSAILEKERSQLSPHHSSDFFHALRSPQTWLLSLIYGLIVWSYLPANSFTPSILKSVLIDAHIIVPRPDASLATAAASMPAATPDHIVNLYLGLLSAIPFGAAVLTMLLIARHSDRRNERKYHMMAACMLMAVGWTLAALGPRFTSGSVTPAITLTGLSLTVIGFFGFGAVFWAVPAQLLTGTAIAAALAIINSIGNLIGSGLGPQVRNIFNLSDRGFMLLAAMCAAGGSICLVFLPLQRRVPQGFPVQALEPSRK